MEKSIVFENAPEQHIYAKIIYHISNLGLFVLIMGFILYIFGVLTPLVPLEELPKYWSLSLTQFLEKTGAPTGWRWTAMLGYGDVIPFLGVTILASVTFVCFLALLFSFLQRGAKVLAFIAAMELFFILISASNLIQISH